MLPFGHGYGLGSDSVRRRPVTAADDDGYLSFLWNHVLPGCELRSLAGATLTFTCTPTLAAALATDSVSLGVTDGPLAVAWPDGRNAPLAQALAGHALFVSGPDPDHGLWLAAEPDGPAEVQVTGAGRAAAFATGAGKRVTQMKAFALGKASAYALRGIVDTPVLRARRAEALAALTPTLHAAGFRGAEPFWVRTEPGVVQGVERVASRWDTPYAVSFHFAFHVRAVELRGHRLPTALSLYAVPGEGLVRTHDLLLGGAGHRYTIGQDTVPADLAADLVGDFRSTFLPWLDTLRAAEAVSAVALGGGP